MQARRLEIVNKLALLVLAALLAPSSAGSLLDAEATSSDPAYAPIQLVVNNIPEVTRLAVEEARFSLTSSDAEKLAKKLVVFAGGLDSPEAFPDGSVATANGAAVAYPYAVQSATVASRLPSVISNVQRAENNCQAYGSTATLSEARQWFEWTRQAIEVVPEARNNLSALAADAPANIDGQPIALAVEHLEAWYEPIAESSVDCVIEVIDEILLNMPETDAKRDLENRLDWLVLVKTDVWLPAKFGAGNETASSGQFSAAAGKPGIGKAGAVAPGQHISLSSSGYGPGAVVVVSSPSLGINAPLTGKQEFVIPANAQLGDHEIVATISDGTTNFTVIKAITVELAPLQLRLVAPESVNPCQEFTVQAFFTTPATDILPTRQNASVSGSHEVEMVVVNGRGKLSLTAPVAPETLSYTVAANWPGFNPASANRDIEVVAGPCGAAQIQEVPYQPDHVALDAVVGTFDINRIWPIAVGVIVVAALFAVTISKQNGAARMAPANQLEIPGFGNVIGAAMPVPVIRAWIRLHNWMLKTGIIQSKHTVRDAANLLAGRGWNVFVAARRFEQVRYGGATEEAGEGLQLATWIPRIKAILGRK